MPGARLAQNDAGRTSAASLCRRAPTTPIPRLQGFLASGLALRLSSLGNRRTLEGGLKRVLSVGSRNARLESVTECRYTFRRNSLFALKSVVLGTDIWCSGRFLCAPAVPFRILCFAMTQVASARNALTGLEIGKSLSLSLFHALFCHSPLPENVGDWRSHPIAHDQCSSESSDASLQLT